MISRPQAIVSPPKAIFSVAETMHSSREVIVSCPEVMLSRPKAMHFVAERIHSDREVIVSCPEVMHSSPKTMHSVEERMPFVVEGIHFVEERIHSVAERIHSDREVIVSHPEIMPSQPKMMHFVAEMMFSSPPLPNSLPAIRKSGPDCTVSSPEMILSGAPVHGEIVYQVSGALNGLEKLPTDWGSFQ
jgi:hypothetical protein